MISYIFAAFGVLFAHLIISFLIRKHGWVKENFKGEKIPFVFGLYIVAYGTIGSLVRYNSDSLAYLIAIIGFGMLGFADDLFGSRDVGGFKGHFKKLLLERQLTTGAAKALGGGLLAVLLGWMTSDGSLISWVINFMVIALAANTINLLDLRPGRAVFAFMFGLGAVLLVSWSGVLHTLPVVAVVASLLFVAHFDYRGQAMLGDVGSNALGAVLGLVIAFNAPLAVRIAAVVIFLVVNIYSEKYSISRLIERHPVLTWIDSKLGVR